MNELVTDGALPSGLDLSRIAAEPPRDAAHGDVTTNAAMVLAKPAGRKPRELAQLLLEKLKVLPDVIGGEIAGPGFINLRLSDQVWRDVLRAVLKTGIAFGDATIGGGENINVEYVSANPTGPMHVGHARGAVVGDALARLLAKVGYAVIKEYYVNDAGGQVDNVAHALHMRYLQVLGHVTAEDVRYALDRKEIQYGGDYLISVAKLLLSAMARNGWA